ncbi:hypothetical protein [Kibdelosporangium aridum]|uniref:hypothetical protein n=1 Tax=Kibdelosporangium aridum TaxID=2030 RepID=UPI00117B017A|nr:hypothetical protein [Kibdelosporangium aridum]
MLYRSLRKAFEDAKNEAGAGDFYYGEMDARRHASTTGRSERALLTLYWMISGYGHRAGRTLAALAVLVVVLFALLAQFGLPASTSAQEMIAKVPAAIAGQEQEIKVDVKPTPTMLPHKNSGGQQTACTRPSGSRWDRWCSATAAHHSPLRAHGRS